MFNPLPILALVPKEWKESFKITASIWMAQDEYQFLRSKSKVQEFTNLWINIINQKKNMKMEIIPYKSTRAVWRIQCALGQEDLVDVTRLNFQEGFDSGLHQRIIKKLTCSWDRKGSCFVYCKLVKKIGKLLALNYHSSWGIIPKSAFFVQRNTSFFKQISGLAALKVLWFVSSRGLGVHTTIYFGQNQSGECISGAYLTYSGHNVIQSRLELVPNTKPPKIYSISITSSVWTVLLYRSTLTGLSYLKM